MSQHTVYRFDDFLVDPANWRLSRNGGEIHVEPVVLNLLIFLIANRDRLVTRQELMDTVWGDTVVSESALSKPVARLRKALGDDSATHRYLETVHSQGYRFVAGVEEVESAKQPGAPAEKVRTPALRHALLAVTAIVVLIILAVAWFPESRRATPREDGVRSLAVLPLGNLTGNPEQDYYVDGLHDILVTELSQIPGLRVTSRQSVRRYRNSELPTADIARELGVDALVEGSLLRAGGEIELTIQLIHGSSDEHLWAARHARDTTDVFDLIADVARSVGAETGATSAVRGNEGSDHESFGKVDPRAIDAYALGILNLDRFTPENMQSAISQLEKAVEIEPRFALAWAQLAAANMLFGLVGYAPPHECAERARAAASKAIEADDQSYVGYSMLAWVRAWTGEVEEGCALFREAVRLNPSDPYAIHGEADYLMLDGRMDESIARLRGVLVVSPFSAVHSRPLPYHLFLARRFDEAVEEVEAARERIPGVYMHYILAWVYWTQGRFDEALATERLELERRGDIVLLTALEEGLEAGGPTWAMRAMAEALVARAEESYVDPFEIGKTFARAGMVDEALHWLNEAADYGSYEITYIEFRLDFDVLRDDPRFLALVARARGE
jgi:TolB-like protein/DNA-binding winged helix-turn-helix (wHTH) protein/tetratricopeptide (TPR) repeat protein